MSLKTYSELITFKTFEDRFNYLKLNGSVGVETFGFDRYLNQKFYASREWKKIRDKVIMRDNGCDLGVEGYDIYGKIIIHHLNPISAKNITDLDDIAINPEFLITTTHDTHNAIHFGDNSILRKEIVIERKPNDTCPWRK